MADSSQISRLVYIEPTDLATEGNALDNVTWQPEELNMSIDLQVIIPDRNYTGELVNNEMNYQFTTRQKEANPNQYTSFLGGSKINGGNFLTTDYLNVSYMELHNDRYGDGECLGVRDISIEYTNYFYPKVTMTFIDIRGESLIGAAEEEYTNGLKGNERRFTSLFRALFRFPYPRFLLSVKGFYGTRVTLDLAVNDFKTSLNASTGNFDVTVTFIGYMYGLYTDLPMNMVMIAPYIGANSGTTSSYWKNNANFTFADGTRMPTFFEFMHRYSRIAEEISNDAAIIEERSHIKEYRKIQYKIEKINSARTAFESYYQSFKTERTIMLKGDKYYAIFSPKINIDDTTLSPIPIIEGDRNRYNLAIEANAKLVETFDNKYDYGKYIFKVGDGGKTMNLPTLISASGEYVKDAVDLNLIQSDTKLFDIIRRNAEQVHDLCYVIVEHGNVIQMLGKKATELNNSLTKVSEKASDEMKEYISKKLTFEPTVQNVFRILFAHIDTLMHAVYEDTLNEISQQQLSGNRVKVSSFSDNGYCSDMPKKTLNNIEVPPFPYVYKVNGDKKTMVYPSMFPTMPEIRLIENLLSSALNFKNSVNELEEVAPQETTENTSGTETNGDGYKMRFIPTCLNDVDFKGVNPYTYLKNKGDNADAIGELLYIFSRRYYANMSTTNATDSDNATKVALAEAMNYKLAKPNISRKFQSDLLEHAQDGDYLLKLLKDYIASREKQIFPGVVVSDNGIRFTEWPLFAASTYVTDNNYSSTEWFPESETDSSTVNSVFRIIDKSEYGNLKSFADITDLKNGNDGYWASANNMEFADSWVQFPLSGNYFDVWYKGQGNSPSRVYPTDMVDNKEGIVIAPYKESDSLEKREYHEEIQYIYKSSEKHKYRFPFLGFESGNSVFRSAFVKNQSSIEARALLFLACFPFTDVTFRHIVKTITSHTSIVAMPKHIVLYVGGLLYREQYMNQNSGNDLITHLTNGKTLNSIAEGYDIRAKLGSLWAFLPDAICEWFGIAPQYYCFSIDGRDRSIEPNRLSEMNEVNKTVLINYFKEWANNEFKLLMQTANQKGVTFENKNHCDCLSDNGIGSLIQRKLIDFYLDEVYVFHNNQYRLDDNVNVNGTHLSSFVSNLKALYADDKTTANEEDAQRQVTTSDITEEMKLSCYQTMKNLYDRWLPSYSMSSFKLPSCEQAEKVKNARLKDNIDLYTSYDTNEYCKFMFVDTFLNDIGDDFCINPRTLYHMLMDSADSKKNYSVYQFMADLLQKNKMMFMAFPMFNNYYNIENIRNIFKPHQLYSNANRISKGLGCCYLGVYTYDMSRNLNLGDSSENCFDNDGVDLADTLGNVGQIGNGNSVQLFEYRNGKTNINVPAFGVTFGRQNQMYFKNIRINSTDAKATDYGIFNTLELAKLGGKGFSNEPFAVGQDVFSIFSNRSYTCTVEMMGCMNIMPMMFFQLNNIPMFKGAYMIIKVSHNISAGSMTTSFTGIRICRNQLPFNKNVFNLNAFSTLLGEYKGRGSSLYTPTTETPITPNPIRVYTGPTTNTKYCDMNIVINSTARLNSNTLGKDYVLTTKSRSCCTSGPTTWYTKGFKAKGYDVTFKWWDTGSPSTAKSAMLGTVGFVAVATATTVNDIRTYPAEEGDIWTYSVTKANGVNTSHACMYDGKRWVSDFIQKGAWVYGDSAKVKEGTVAVLWRLSDAEFEKTEFFKNKNKKS